MDMFKKYFQVYSDYAQLKFKDKLVGKKISFKGKHVDGREINLSGTDPGSASLYFKSASGDVC